MPVVAQAMISPRRRTIQPIIISIGNNRAARGFSGRPGLSSAGHLAIRFPPRLRRVTAIRPSAMVMAPSMKPSPENLKEGTHQARVCRVTLAWTRALPAAVPSRTALVALKKAPFAAATCRENRKAAITIRNPSQANIR